MDETADDERVTPLELFFDLVFVFAVTQVTQLIADRPTWEGLAQAVVLLALIWWAWAAYAWLTDTLDTRRHRVRIVVFGAMMAMFVVALAIPGAFGDTALLFAVAYAAVRIAHVLLFGLSGDATITQSARALLPSVTAACGLVLAASLLDGAAQGAVFVAAIVIDYVGGGRGIAGWTLHPGYFAERHGLIVIIAFGESIVATGIGAAETDLGVGEIVAAALTIALAAAMWWAYFDVTAPAVEERLRAAAPGREQNSLARDAYSYLHLAFIVAIVLVALGGKKVIGQVEDPLKLVPAVCLCGGVALYLLTHVVFRRRGTGSVDGPRALVAIAAVALVAAAIEIPALVSLGLVTALVCGLVAYEAAGPGLASRPEPAPG